MKVDQMDGKTGDIVLFEGTGFVFGVLSKFLGLFYPSWRKRSWKPWHTAWIYQRCLNGAVLFEALGHGVCLNYRSDEELSKARVYRWLDVVEQEKVEAYIKEVEHCKYDVAVYFHTFSQYVLLRVVAWLQDRFHIKASISIPRVLDSRYTCWENVFYFCRKMGKPIQEATGSNIDRYPLITDLILALEV